MSHTDNDEMLHVAAAFFFFSSDILPNEVSQLIVAASSLEFHAG